MEGMMSTVVLSTKGQIVLPKSIRKRLNLQQGTRIQIAVEQDRIVLTPLTEQIPAATWQSWRGRLAGSNAIEEHLAEHAQEVENERLS
jgi:AbrB family looped-hinge helix DNA binding protein